MPNWCTNNFALNGPKELMEKIWAEVKTLDVETGLLNAMVPIGEWEYGAAVNAWGTKWDVDSQGMEYFEQDGNATILGFFESAWSPPIQAFRTFCEKNKGVSAELSYFEPGVQFVGRWNSDGMDEFYEFDSEDLSVIPDDLREEFEIDNWYALED